jgi:hypothetical protein
MDFTDKLKDLKSQLNNLGNMDMTEEKEPKKDYSDNKEILSKTLKELKEMQKTKKHINVGGEIFVFSTNKLQNTLFENIFINESNNYFYDSNPRLFRHIHFIITNLNKQINEKLELQVHIEFLDDETVLKEMIKEVFSKSEEEIFRRIKIVRKNNQDQRYNQKVEEKLEVNSRPRSRNDSYDSQRAISERSYSQNSFER